MQLQHFNSIINHKGRAYDYNEVKSSQAKPTGCKDFKATSGERAYSTQAPIQAQKYHVPVVLSSSGFVSL